MIVKIIHGDYDCAATEVHKDITKETYDQIQELLKPKLPSEWSDDFYDRGLMTFPNETYRNLYKVEKLRDIYRGDWVPDWEDGSIKYCIKFIGNSIDLCKRNYNNEFLSFPTEERRDLFLKNFEELIIKAKPLLG